MWTNLSIYSEKEFPLYISFHYPLQSLCFCFRSQEEVVSNLTSGEQIQLFICNTFSHRFVFLACIITSLLGNFQRIFCQLCKLLLEQSVTARLSLFLSNLCLLKVAIITQQPSVL